MKRCPYPPMWLYTLLHCGAIVFIGPIHGREWGLLAAGVMASLVGWTFLRYCHATQPNCHHHGSAS